MALPKISHPTFEFIKPSNNKVVIMRPFTISEEKIMLIAKQTDDSKEISRALIQIINNCIIDDTDITKFTTFDFDWAFLRLRAQSVDNTIELNYEDEENEKNYKFVLNLDDITAPIPTTNPSVVQINETLKMSLKFPTVADMEEVYKAMGDSENVDIAQLTISKCIDKIFDDDQVYELDNPDSPSEILEFIDNLSKKDYNQVSEFFNNIPEIKHTLKYTDHEDVEREIVLRGIQSFFTF